MGVKITVLGVNETKAFLNRKEKAVKEGAINALDIVGGYMEGEVKSSIAGQRDEPRSVDTGRFINSVAYKLESDATIVSTDIEYAPELEYGTTRFRPRRHFNNSLDRNKKKIKEYFENEIKRKI